MILIDLNNKSLSYYLFQLLKKTSLQSIIRTHHTTKRLEYVRQECSLSAEAGWCWDSESTGSGFVVLTDVLSQLGGVSLISVTSGLGSHSNNSGVNGAGHAVLLLNVDLWQLEVAVIIGVVLLDVSLGRSVHHVSHLEPLDGLIFWGVSTAVQASNTGGVTLVLLPSSVISSL